MMERPYIEEIKKEGASYVQMPKEDYITLMDRLEDLEDIESVSKAKRLREQGEESFPVELTKFIIQGEHPVRIYREYRNLTQQALADKASINRVYLTEIENGKKPGSVTAIKAVAQALDVDINNLV